jgi:hypothetical protein
MHLDNLDHHSRNTLLPALLKQRLGLAGDSAGLAVTAGGTSFGFG